MADQPPAYEEKKGFQPIDIPQQQYPPPQQQYPPPQQQYPSAQQQYFQPQQPAGFAYNQGPQTAVQPMVNAPIQNNVNMTGAPPSTTVIIQGQVRPSSYMGLACCVIWCCNPLVGIIAFVFSMLSSSAADENDLSRARTMGRLSMWFSIAGMIITVVLVGVIVGVVVNESKDANYYGYK